MNSALFKKYYKIRSFSQNSGNKKFFMKRKRVCLDMFRKYEKIYIQQYLHFIITLKP